MKSELLQSLDEVHGSETGNEQLVQQENDGKSADTSLDNEYAAFQVNSIFYWYRCAAGIFHTQPIRVKWFTMQI